MGAVSPCLGVPAQGGQAVVAAHGGRKHFQAQLLGQPMSPSTCADHQLLGRVYREQVRKTAYAPAGRIHQNGPREVLPGCVGGKAFVMIVSEDADQPDAGGLPGACKVADPDSSAVVLHLIGQGCAGGRRFALGGRQGDEAAGGARGTRDSQQRCEQTRPQGRCRCQKDSPPAAKISERVIWRHPERQRVSPQIFAIQGQMQRLATACITFNKSQQMAPQATRPPS